MKKFMLPIVLVAGVVYLVSGKAHPPSHGSRCNAVDTEKDILLPVERLLWVPDAP